jgi:Mn2+/Fe2+ NRAMP family transporter
VGCFARRRSRTPAGVKVNSIDDVGLALVPFAHGYATTLFATGLFGASLFGAVILLISTSLAICEAMGWEHGLNRRYSEAPAFYGIFTAILVIGAHVNPSWLNVVSRGSAGVLTLLSVYLPPSPIFARR